MLYKKPLWLFIKKLKQYTYWRDQTPRSLFMCRIVDTYIKLTLWVSSQGELGRTHVPNPKNEHVVNTVVIREETSKVEIIWVRKIWSLKKGMTEFKCEKVAVVSCIINKIQVPLSTCRKLIWKPFFNWVGTSTTCKY